MRCLSVCMSAMTRRVLCAGLIAGLSTAATTMADTPVYDGMTGQPIAANAGVPNPAGVPANSGNRQMGVPVNLADPASLELTGFDFTWVNSTGAAVTLDATHRLRLNYWVWNTVTFAATGTMASRIPPVAARSRSPQPLQWRHGQQSVRPVRRRHRRGGLVQRDRGSAGHRHHAAHHRDEHRPNRAGFQLGEATAAPGTFAQVSGSTSVIVGGADAVAPALGTNAFAAPNLGYYRSPNWGTVDNNGNFDAASGRQVGANSSLAVRVYAAGTAVNVCCNTTTGVCSATAAASCPSGSTFQANVACTPNPCPAPNACCNTATGACVALLSGSCASGFTQATGVSCTPTPCGPILNDACAGAITLPLTGTVVNGSNVGATADALGGCAFDLVDGAAVWFQFTGTGNNVTVSTCDAFTTLDTIVHVYCAPSACAGPFNCVGGNDDANPACGAAAFASTVTVPTVSGNQYYVVVNGFQGATGNFGISATDTGTVSTDTATCASRARCVVDTDAFDFAELDACGAGTGLDTNNSCATATIYPTLGQVAKGFLATTGNFRDIDIYQLPASTAGQSVAIAVRAESPTLVQMLNDASGNCSTAFTVVAASTFGLAACLDINDPVLDVAVPATGRTYFLITTPSFDGNPCGSGDNSQNDYRLRISITELGACCIPATNCTTLSLSECATAGGLTWFGSLACSLGGGNVDPCTVTVGTCCTSAGVCSVVPNANFPQGTDCTTAGGTFTANPNATCTPNPCAPAGVCCRGATCNNTVTSSAACTGSLISGGQAGAAFITSSSTCGAGVISSSPCCLANYDKTGGITVNDIFAFLNDWFAGSPYANTGGNGNAAPLSVNNIFDFLTNWFNGGCN